MGIVFTHSRFGRDVTLLDLGSSKLESDNGLRLSWNGSSNSLVLVSMEGEEHGVASCASQASISTESTHEDACHNPAAVGEGGSSGGSGNFCEQQTEEGVQSGGAFRASHAPTPKKRTHEDAFHLLAAVSDRSVGLDTNFREQWLRVVTNWVSGYDITLLRVYVPLLSNKSFEMVAEATLAECRVSHGNMTPPSYGEPPISSMAMRKVLETTFESLASAHPEYPDIHEIKEIWQEHSEKRRKSAASRGA